MRLTTIAASSFALVISFIAIAISYGYGPGPIFDVSEAAGSVFFWAGIFTLVIFYTLKKTAMLFLSYLRTFKGGFVFVTYLSIHLLLYGLILERIFTFVYRLPTVVSQATVTAS